MPRKRLIATTLFATALATGAFAEPSTPLIAQSCAGCHGQSGEGQGAITSIAGLDREDFIKKWEEFRNDERPATIMNRIARGFTAEEVAILADYFASIE